MNKNIIKFATVSSLALFGFNAVAFSQPQQNVVSAQHVSRHKHRRRRGWQKIKGKRYYYRHGRRVKGFQNIAHHRYYFSKKSGRMLTGWRTIKGKLYYFSKKNGVMFTGMHKFKHYYWVFNKRGVQVNGYSIKTYRQMKIDDWYEKHQREEGIRNAARTRRRRQAEIKARVAQLLDTPEDQYETYEVSAPVIVYNSLDIAYEPHGKVIATIPPNNLVVMHECHDSSDLWIVKTYDGKFGFAKIDPMLPQLKYWDMYY